MSRFLGDLSEDQRRVAEALSGHNLVLAGPGSGKTATVTAKLAHIFDTGALPAPYRAVALTFTHDAARQMRVRLRRLGFTEWDRLFCGTYHSFGQHLLRAFGRHIGLSEDFEVDPPASVALLTKIEADYPTFRQGSLALRIERAKRRGARPSDIPAPDDQDESAFREAYTRYETQMRANGLLDYGDLILNAVRLCTQCPQVLAALNNAYRYVVADEFQDTDEQQLAMVIALAKPHGSTIVADDDQSIYSWRGAVRENVTRAADMLGARPFLLGTNFRSDAVIVEAAQAVIAGDPGYRGKPLRANSDARGAIVVEEYKGKGEEADSICSRIADLVDGGGDVKSHEICVISRARARVQTLLDRMTESGIVWFDRDRLRYDDTPDARLTLAVLAMAQPADRARVLHDLIVAVEDMGLDRHRREDAVSIARQVMAAAATHSWTSEVTAAELHRVLDAVGLFQHIKSLAVSESDQRLRAANVELLLQEVVQEVERGVTLAAAVRRFLGLDAVQVLTGHGAKGLEFDVVFVVGLEEDTLPSYYAQNDAAQLAEERRIFYVALTRARQLAHLSYVQALPNRYGRMFPKAPSRFLEAISSVMRTPWPR